MTLEHLCCLAGACVSAGCLEPNPDWRPQPNLATPDMCPNYPADGGGGKNRPEVLVPSGNGSVGGSGSYPIAAFYLDVFEVTVGAYRECVEEGKCLAPRDMLMERGCNWSASALLRENHPINCINWEQASAFCIWAKPRGGRLPTEAEWEYAAGGAAGAASTYPWGTEEPIQMGAGSQACYGRSDSTCPVGRYPRTLLGGRTCGGVVDLAGGIYEWTSSEYMPTYMPPAKSCEVNSTWCSLRGGSWLNGTNNLQTSNRYNYGGPALMDKGIGARCARTP